LVAYDSDEEAKKAKIQDITRKLKMIQRGVDLASSDFFTKRQVIVCSRTHSQISQFVNEIKKTPFQVKVVPLISRKGLCVNEKLKDLPSLLQLNDKCQDLLDKGQCPHAEADVTEYLADLILDQPLDIEDIASKSKTMKVCGYYASRRAIQEADVLIVPYQSLISEATRESLGIQLHNRLVIFDEAHNIMDTVTSMNTVALTYSEIYHGYSSFQ